MKAEIYIMNKSLPRLLIVLLITLSIVFFAPLGKAYAFKDGCLDHRWITIKTNQAKQCPVASGWLASSLFDRYTNLENPLLDDYCVYEKLLLGGTPGTSGVPVELQKLINNGEIKSNLEQDCLVVGPLAAADVVAIQEAQLISQIDKASLPAISQELHHVRLSIIDTLPTAPDATKNINTNSSHGASLVAIAHKLVCGAKGDLCYADIASQLAMPYIAIQNEKDYRVYQDTFRGGYFGSISNLATAIRKEVVSWRNNSPGSRLVINLSLGWNPHSWGGASDIPEEYAASVSSVYHAIEDAVCRGALVIAAAGNQGKNDANDQQPMLPAKWEELPAPSNERCLALTGELPVEKLKRKDPSSLVYAISGVDSHGQPLKNTRKHAKARIGAYADHVAVDSHITNKEDTMTGSSVSAVVVSSIASMVWSHRPDLNAAEVMELIYRAGDKLDYTADFLLINSTLDKQARRASMCSALTEACQGGYCSLPGICSWSKKYPNYLASSLFTAPINQHYQLGELEVCRTDAPNCYLNETESGPISPWIMPQPDPLPCPNCLHPASQSSLVIETSSSYTGELTQAELVVDNTIYRLPKFSLGDRILIEDFHADPIINEAYISVLIDGEHRITIPLLVSQ